MKKAPRRKGTDVRRPRPRHDRTGEVVGVLLLLLAAFVLASLASHDGRDPSWSNIPPPGHQIRNFAGRTGATLSATLLDLLGLTAFLLPFAFGALGAAALFRRGAAPLLRRSAGFLLLFVLLAPLLHLAFGRVPWRGGEIQAGGIAGDLIYTLLHGALNTLGTLIVLTGGLILVALFSTRFSVARTLRFCRGACRSAVKDVRIRIVRFRKGRAKDKMRRRIVQKYAAPAEDPPPEKRQADADDGGSRTSRRAERDLARERKRQEKEAAREAKKRAKAKPARTKGPAQPEKMLFPDLGRRGDYQFPPFSLLDPGKPSEKIDKSELYEKKQRIEEKLKEFGVEGEVREYHPGPVITTYEFYPAPGIKVSQVANLTEELSLALEAEAVRIQRIPGKSSLGVEIPNNKRELIKLRDIIQSEKFLQAPGKLTFALGKTVHGEPYVTSLDVMPHLLIAGATGTGKSVALNALIASLLYKATPEEVKLILIDPKRVEFTLYDGIPHLLAPVIKDSKKAGIILMDTVRKMEERYRQLNKFKVRNIEQYNQLVKQLLADKRSKLTDEERKGLEPLPYLVIIIDELAELMMVGAQEVEYCITRLAQLARAVGIHLVMATQRPSIDVITGTIKNNFGCRVAFRVPSKIDSRIILDQMGAEKLLGNGDMLFLPPNYPRIIRLHCSYISVPEVQRLIKHVKSQGIPEYDERIVQVLESPDDKLWDDDGGAKDELFDKALETVLRTGQASASFLQRRMKLGYARAARLIDQMEREGVIGPADGSKAREILVDPKTYLRERLQGQRRED